MSLKKLTPIAAAVSLGLSALTAPVVASAETSASFAASNFYFWRGQNISNGAGAVSGSLDYSHESGAYAGVWTSSETAKSEYDLYFGFGGEAGDFGYDISVWEYMYPEAAGSDDIGDSSEIIVSGSIADFSAAVYFSLQDSDTQYVTLGYQMDKLGVTLGTWLLEDGDAEYTHLDFSYAANDELTFTFSKVVDIVDGGEDDLMVNVSWSKSFDL